ncbi:MAG: hypothetical protein IKK70_04355 [Clostridia bacterium]|nr:hypothetical protein [Clostridia bacterium]
MKNQNNVQLDERQMQIRAKTTLVALTFALISLIVATAVRIMQTDDIGWEFWVMLGIILIMAVGDRFFGDIEEPKDMLGRPLPLGNNKEDRAKRIKNYALESGIFALACAVMDILLIATGKDDVTDMELAEMLFPNLDKVVTVAITAVIAFVTMFVISFIFEYVIGEKYKVKKYNALLAKLDAEENEE